MPTPDTSDKPTTASAIRAKITGMLAGRAKTEQEIAELEKQARWLDGQARRDRLTGYAEEAGRLASTAADTTADIAEASLKVGDAIRHLKSLGELHNEALAAIRRKIVAEGVHGSFTPPSPADGSVGVDGSHVVIGEHHIVPVDVGDLVEAAVKASNDPDAAPAVPAAVIHRPMIEGDAKFWINRASGTTLASNNGYEPHGCEEISRVEYLAHHWKLHLTDLPAELLDELSDNDRARLVPDFLAELDDSAKAEFSKRLVPGSKDAA